MPDQTTSEDSESQQLRNAEADAAFLIEKSAVIRSLVCCDAIAQKIILFARQHLEQNITQDWEVSNKDLVIQTFETAAHDSVIEAELDPKELRDDILKTLAPVLDVFAQLKLAEKEESSRT